jgi:hypothetical protein
LAPCLHPVRFTLCGLFALGLLTSARVNAQAHGLSAVLDRDGGRDVVAAHGMSATALWVSRSKSDVRPHIRRPVVYIAVDDSGDRRLDLVASDAAVRTHAWHRMSGVRVRPSRIRLLPLASRVGHGSALQRAAADPITAVIDEAPSTPPCDTSHPAGIQSLDLRGTISSAPGLASAGAQREPHQPRAPPVV